MAGLFSLRNTSIGAGTLLVLAVLFTDRSGIGGSVVAPGAEQQEPAAETQRAAAPRTPSQWFAVAADEAPPVIVAPPPVQEVLPQVEGEIHPPAPVGPDFPPELNR